VSDDSVADLRSTTRGHRATRPAHNDVAPRHRCCVADAHPRSEHRTCARGGRSGRPISMTGVDSPSRRRLLLCSPSIGASFVLTTFRRRRMAGRSSRRRRDGYVAIDARARTEMRGSDRQPPRVAGRTLLTALALCRLPATNSLSYGSLSAELDSAWNSSHSTYRSASVSWAARLPASIGLVEPPVAAVGRGLALELCRPLVLLGLGGSPRGSGPICPDGSIWAGVERVLVASSGLGRLALELPAARVSGWLPNEAPAGQDSVTAWLERGEQHLHQECPS
jgi:hypothetical protein